MHLQILSFFCFLICSSEAIECPHCLVRDSDHCPSEGTINCDGNEGCAAASGFFQDAESKKTKFLYKGCRFPVKCGTWLCISINGTYFQSYISCCEGDKCYLPYCVPDDKYEAENNYDCESCYEEGTTEGCSSDQRIRCRVDETICVDYRGNVLKYDAEGEAAETLVSLKGCANPEAYDHFEFFYSFKEIERVHYSYTDASG